MKLSRLLAKNYINFRGWSTKRKILVIESDDWGSIRMPNKQVYNVLLNSGIPVDKNYFTKFDTLESKEDLEALFNLLVEHKDINGNYPVITANALVTNPDFKRIEESDFQTYHYEHITETYKSYFGNSQVFDIWQSTLGNKLLYPQFHGREHIGIWEWMHALRSREGQELLGFNNKAILGLGNRKSLDRQKDYTAAFDFVSDEEKQSLELIIRDGLDIFERTFGFKSKSFIAPASIRHDFLDKVLSENGVLYHQGGQYYQPTGKGTLLLTDRYWGATNRYKQIYWRRNVTFEPSKAPDTDWVDSCMQEIAIAFRWGKPAVVNSHRVNFVGSIDFTNRDNSLKLLKELLLSVQKKWPDIEFLNSEQLGDIIRTDLGLDG